MDLVSSLKQFMVTAGAEWVMWLMIGLSVLSAVVVVERLWLLRSLRDDPARLARDFALALEDSFEAAMARLRRSPSAEAAVVMAGMSMSHRGPEAVQEAMAGAAVLQRTKLEKRLAFLATVGSNAPFIGLFGTVIGIVGAFDALDQVAGAGAVTASAGLMAPEAVMSAIGEALVATAVGIAIAIPAVAANNYFQRAIRLVLANTEALTHVLLAHVKGDDLDEPPAGEATASA